MIKSIFAIAIALMTTVSVAFAQKFGHVNSQEVLMQMPKVQAAKKTLEDYQKVADDQLKTLAGLRLYLFYMQFGGFFPRESDGYNVLTPRGFWKH